MIRRLWSRVRLTPRLGIVIVLALLATQLLREFVLVTLVPPPNILFYTRDWLADQAAHAVQVAEATPPAARAAALASLSSDWLAFSVPSEATGLKHDSGESLDTLRTILKARLGNQARRVLVSGESVGDRDSATSAITIVLAALPAVLTGVVTDHLQKERDMLV